MSRTIGTLVLCLTLAIATHARADTPSDSQKGHEIFEKWCAGCHNPNPALQKHGGGLVGQVFAGTYTLEQRYKGTKPAALEQRTDLTSDFIKYTVRHGLNMMPRSRKTEISDSDLDALATYLTQHDR